MKKSFLLKFALPVFILIFLIFSCTKENSEVIEETIEDLTFFSITIDGQTETLDTAFAYYCSKDDKEYLRVANNPTLLDTSLFDPPYAPYTFTGWYSNNGTDINEWSRVYYEQMNNGVLDTIYLSHLTTTFDIAGANDNYVKGSVIGTFELLNNDTVDYLVEFYAEILPTSFTCN
ncbi:MAG: hypothetical protein AB8F94_29620 [Saprospiraceae bacterium]